MDYQGKLKEGIALKNQERYEEAAAAFGEAIALDKTQPEAYFYRANILNHSLKTVSYTHLCWKSISPLPRSSGIMSSFKK